MAFIRLHHVSKTFGDSTQPAVNRFQLEIEQGEIVSLLGPSGCGKTTTLRMIAGFEQPDSGTIFIGDKLVCDGQYSLPPEKRGIGMIFQDYALFPHLTIMRNVTFGLHKWKSKDRAERAEEVLQLVGLAELSERYPHELSGGQQQRVALARALAPRPYVVLMDEPFSNLDTGLREKMRHDVTDILRRSHTTAIIVTHDQKDALAVSDRVVVMNEGVIQQIASPKELYQYPKNGFVAQFVGKTNLLTGTLDQDMKHVHTKIGKVCLPKKTGVFLDQATLSIRPESCHLDDQGIFSGVVEKVTYGGDYQELQVKLKTQADDYQSIIMYAPTQEDIKAGKEISFSILPELVALVD